MRVRQAQQIAAQRLLSLELDVADQALILYYSYMMLCDSVSAKSKEILGIELDTQQIQASFAKRAVQALQQEGLIRTPQKASA